MADEATGQRKGREGGRWVNERPPGEEVAAWFRENVKIDEKLDAEKYVGGIVLIPTTSKAKTVTGFNTKGEPNITDVEELSYTPYAKVETRVNYFWDLVAAHEEDWVAVIEHVETPRLPVDGVQQALEAVMAVEHPELSSEQLTAIVAAARPGGMAQLVHQLPRGFTVMSVPVGENYSHFLTCTMRVAIYLRADYEREPERAVPLRSGRGTKQVPLTKSTFNGQRTWADDSSLMKAETGALGRALGFAGIFVIPGSGVATAEDMLESMTQGAAPAEPAPSNPDGGQGPAAPETPPVRTGAEQAEDEETQLRTRALELHKALREDHPTMADEFATWARNERKLEKLTDAHGAVLRGVVKKLEKLLDEGKERAQQAPKEEADVPSEAPETTQDDAEEGAVGGEPSGQAG